jgi:RHS repeat-associated protein
MRLGNGRFESTQFNSRLQPTQIALGTSANNTSLLKLNYDYGTTDNNGNVKSQTITVPTVGNSQGFVATQTYEYDELNRIKSAVETSNSQTNWQQYFRYDRYGNRTVITEQNRIGQEAFTTASIVGLNPDINIANNRIVPKPNSTEQYQFDASGNMTRDAVGNVYSYDAENHQTQYFESTNTTTPKAKYFYDGDGRRVKKVVKVQSGQQTVDETTLFVYDGGGALVAEYTQNAPANTNPQTVYLTADVLGSPRINTNQKGEVVARHDYLPFGDEIIGLGQRSQHQEYVDDNVRKKFTGYEKDEESGLDFAQARYYGNGLGRFTSADPAISSIRIKDPQSWNRYAYVGNNPISRRDPTGLDWNIKVVTIDGYLFAEPEYVNCNGCGNWTSQYGYVFRNPDGKWTALNPFENEGASSAFNTKAEALEAFNSYKKQASIDIVAGAVSEFSLLATIAGKLIKNKPYNENSEQFKFGQQLGRIMSYVSIATGGVIISMVAGGKLLKSLNNIMEKYPTTSMYCDRAAKQILEAFGKAGVKGEIVTLADKGGASFLKNAAGETVAETGFHQVVRIGDRFYDALTGPEGATWEEYLKLWHPDTAIAPQ